MSAADSSVKSVTDYIDYFYGNAPSGCAIMTLIHATVFMGFCFKIEHDSAIWSELCFTVIDGHKNNGCFSFIIMHITCLTKLNNNTIII